MAHGLVFNCRSTRLREPTSIIQRSKLQESKEDKFSCASSFMWSARPVQLLSPSQSTLARRRVTEKREIMGEKKSEIPILFKDDVLKVIRTLIEVSEGYRPGEQESAEQIKARKVVTMLEKIGLMSFLSDVWDLQHVPICDEFVRNWNSKTNSTYVFSCAIYVSFNNFVMATSRSLPYVETQLDAARKGKMSPSFQKRTLSLFSPAPDEVPKGGLMLDHCNQPTLKAVLKLLNMTLWTKASGHHRVSGDLLHLVVQADEGNILDWKKLFYDKFLWEMARLKALLERRDQNLVRNPRVQTVLGPAMCSMYNLRTIYARR